MAGAAPQPKNRQSNSHIVALLSLKILLLAFFILLNALATFQEERSSAVVDSVRDAFQGLLPVGRRGAADPGGVGLFDGGEDIVDNLMRLRSEEHTSELQSLMRLSYAVFCLKKKNTSRRENTYAKL